MFLQDSAMENAKGFFEMREGSKLSYVKIFC